MQFEPGYGGLDLTASLQPMVEERLRSLDAPDPGSGDYVGMHQAAASINAVGTHAQKERFLPAIFVGTENWCQLFSEPGAGSDLAGLATMAVRDGDEWVVHGQKVWTSGAARTRAGRSSWPGPIPTSAKHRGLTFFVCDMELPGIEIRPLRQADGARHFNEVFLDGVRLADELRLGDVGQGWAVSLAGLSSERESIGEAIGSPIGDVLEAWARFDAPSPAIAAVQRQRVAAAWIDAKLLRPRHRGARLVAEDRPQPGQPTDELAARRPARPRRSGRLRLRRRP